MSAVLFTAPEVAKKLKVTPQYVRRLIKTGRLAASQLGTQWVVEPQDLQDYIINNNILIEPDDHPRSGQTVPNIVALSFFSGAMGLDIGMKNGGISALLACEFNKYCRMTIEKNEPQIALVGDINQCTPEHILQMAGVPAGRKVDVIFGGPPCQAFSTAGKRAGFDDDRGNVFLRYLDIIDALRPTYIVIENVRGLLSAPYCYGGLKEPVKGGALCVVLDRLRASGYSVSFNLYNAANYGAPQIRERVVIIAKQGSGKVPYLLPTNTEHGTGGLPPWKTLRTALDERAVEEHHYIVFPEARLKYYRMLKEGQYWKHLPEAMQREAMGAKLELGGGKTGFYRRLSFDRPSPTLVTNPTMPATDLCHPTENRPLSVEEYGCIQGFPEAWEICGPILEQYKQIGNAVPIKLGEAIARTILADMGGTGQPSKANFPYSRYKSTNEITWTADMERRLKKAWEDERKEAAQEEPPVTAP